MYTHVYTRMYIYTDIYILYICICFFVNQCMKKYDIRCVNVYTNIYTYTYMYLWTNAGAGGEGESRSVFEADRVAEGAVAAATAAIDTPAATVAAAGAAETQTAAEGIFCNAATHCNILQQQCNFNNSCNLKSSTHRSSKKGLWK